MEFVDRDVSADEAARTELLERHGRLATPTIVIDGKVFVGFKDNRQEIERALAGSLT